MARAGTLLFLLAAALALPALAEAQRLETHGTQSPAIIWPEPPEAMSPLPMG
jgi:hypothetical protein